MLSPFGAQKPSSAPWNWASSRYGTRPGPLDRDALAARARLSRVYIAKLERAQQDPSLTTIEKLAKALKVKPGALME